MTINVTSRAPTTTANHLSRRGTARAHPAARAAITVTVPDGNVRTPTYRRPTTGLITQSTSTAAINGPHRQAIALHLSRLTTTREARINPTTRTGSVPRSVTRMRNEEWTDRGTTENPQRSKRLRPGYLATATPASNVQPNRMSPAMVSPRPVDPERVPV